MFNKVILVGNLTKDIELRYLNNNSAIGKTAIATNRKYSVNGEQREEVCFIDITFWGRTAEIAHQYLKKGSRVLIEGRLMFEQWSDNNGQNRSKHSVTVENMKMLGDSNYQANNSYQPKNSNQGARGHAPTKQNNTNNYDDGYDPEELPF